jgi:hypothetical protein
MKPKATKMPTRYYPNLVTSFGLRTRPKRVSRLDHRWQILLAEKVSYIALRRAGSFCSFGEWAIRKVGEASDGNRHELFRPAGLANNSRFIAHLLD